MRTFYTQGTLQKRIICLELALLLLSKKCVDGKESAIAVPLDKYICWWPPPTLEGLILRSTALATDPLLRVTMVFVALKVVAVIGVLVVIGSFGARV